MHRSCRTCTVPVAASSSIAPTGQAIRQGAFSQWTHRTGTLRPGVQETRTRERLGGDSKMAEIRLPEREWAMEHWTSHVRQAVHFLGSRAIFCIGGSPFLSGAGPAGG